MLKFKHKQGVGGMDDLDKAEKTKFQEELVGIATDSSTNPTVVAAGHTTPERRSILSPPKNNKKRYIIAAAFGSILILAGAWYFFLRKDNKSSNTTSNVPANKSEEPTSTGAINDHKVEAVNVVYSNKVGVDAAAQTTVYIRPAKGGEKQEVLKLGAQESVTQSTISKDKIAIATVGGNVPALSIYFSSDGGSSFKKIYNKANQDLDITSMKFSIDGTGLAIGLLESVGAKNKVMSLALDGSGTLTDLFTATTAGVYILSYDTQKKQVVYSESCWNCDGVSTKAFYVNKYATKEKITLYESVVGGLMGKVSRDGNLLLVAEGAKYTGPEIDALGTPITQAPYKFVGVDLGTLDKKDIAIVDEAVDDVGLISNVQPVYVSGKKIVELASTPFSLFESDNSIVDSSSLYVSDSEVFAATSPNTLEASFSYSRYDVKAKTNTNILNSDVNTQVFGVTTN